MAVRRPVLLTMRQSAALVRLVLLYGCLCGLLLAAGLQRRADLATQRSLIPTPGATPTGLPFAGVNIDPAAYAPEERPLALRALADAGFDWVRLRFDWGAIEPQKGVYTWAAADAWIDEIAAAGLAPLVVLDGSPAWARAADDRTPTDNPLAPPAEPSDLAQFAGVFATRYGDRVRFYQVWDEPNIAPHWGNRLIEPVAYAQLLKATAAAIRAADPGAVIAAAALAPTADRGHTAIDEVYFWQRLVAAGAADVVDAVAIQPYGFGHAPEYAGRSFGVLDFQRAAQLRRQLAAMGLGDKALWAVRSGWNRLPNATWGAVTAQDQARYAVAAYNAAWRDWPWMEALGWAIDQPAAAGDNPIWGFALRQQDGAAAPVLSALQGWLASRASTRPSSPASATGSGGWLQSWLLPWLAIAGGLALVAWRSAAAARLLPWPAWIAGWRQLPWPAQALGWGGLLLLYYLAVWPPLIGLCWLLWGLLCLAQPRAGLALAALLLPFYYQHKELQLVNAVLTAPPATVAVACLLPGLLLHGRRSGFRLAVVDAAPLALLGISLLSAARVWHWQAFGQGLLDLVLVPLGLWFAVRVLSEQGAVRGGEVTRPHARRTRFEAGQRQGAERGAIAAPDRRMPSPSAGASVVPGAGAATSPDSNLVAGAWHGITNDFSHGLMQMPYSIAFALFCGGVLVAAWGLLAWLAGQGVQVDGVLRLVGPHFSPNHTALYLLRTLFLGCGLVAGAAWAAAHGRAYWTVADSPAHPLTLSSAPGRADWTVTILLGCAVGLVLVALVLTGSRGALLLGLPAGALVMGWTALRRQPGLLRWLAMHPVARFLAAAGLLALVVVAVLLWDRLLNRQTLSLRIDLWEASLRLWRDHLLLGVGPGGFFWNYPAYLPLGGASEPNQLHPHNVWLEVATTWGLLGFAWLGLVVWQVAGLWQRQNRQAAALDWIATGLLAGLLAAFAHAQVDAFLLLPDLAGWNMLALGLIAGMQELRGSGA